MPPENMEAARQQWHALFAPETESVMQQLFKDEAAAEAFAPFLDISMDKEEELLRNFAPAAHKPQRSPEPVDPKCPVARFAQVPKELRWQLRHAADSEELLTIQNAIIDYLCTVREPDFAGEALELVLNDSYERLLGHAVAIFYNLHSFSEDINRDRGQPQRRTYMRCKKNVPALLPSVQLVEYLSLLISATGYFSYGAAPQRRRQSRKKFRKHGGK